MSSEYNDDSKPAPTHHFGRGGAGNKVAKDPKSPLMVPTATPTLKENMYTTGRGGSGNMAKNDPSRPEEARAAQDVEDIPAMPLPEGPRIVGRGGGGNIHKPTEEERAANQRLNEQHRRESSSRDRSGLKALADKGKELLTGKKKSDKATEDE